MKTKAPAGCPGDELTWPSCVKVLIQVSTIFLMPTWWFCFLQKTELARQTRGPQVRAGCCAS